MKSFTRRATPLWLFLSFLVCVGCSQKSTPRAKSSSAAVAFQVRSRPVLEGAITEYFRYAGRLRSAELLVVQPEVPGRIKRLLREVGDRVREGDLLLELESTTIEAQRNQAKAFMEIGKAAWEDSEKNWKRSEALYRSQGVSETEREKASLQRESSLRQYEQSQAAFRAAEYALSQTKVRAPFAGKITLKSCEEGEYFLPGAKPEGVYTLERDDRIFVDVDVPSTDSPLIEKGASVEVESSSGWLAGKVISKGERADPLSSSFPVRALVDNPKGWLKPGSVAGMKVHYRGREKTLVVPLSALSEGDTLFVKEGNTVHERKVTVGLRNPEWVEILKGLKVGERAVVEGNFGLYEGALVEEIQ